MITAVSAGVTLAVTLTLALIWAVMVYTLPGPVSQTGANRVVDLREGAALSEIAAALERNDVVSSGPLFAAAAQITGSARRLKAGEYSFPARLSMARVMDMIRRGRIVRHQVTVPEGLPAEAVIDILMKNPILTGVVAVPPEGAVLPETYEVKRGEDRAAVLARMMTAQDNLIADLWPKRRDGLPFSSPEEAVTLASIVEKETGKADERPRIAAVFINRLQRGMRLESDPTIIYGLTRGKPLGRGLKASEVAARTPYNTYAIDGLPPTPIANPGRAALAAVLDPPPSSELFFVADGTGGHVFAVTYDEHLKNVARWRRIERREQAPQQPKPKAP
jgi:UPF0755 protein